MKPEDEPLARRLRRVVQLACILAVLALPLAFLPGERVYDDSSNCFGSALVGMMMTEHGSNDACTPTYDHLIKEKPAGGVPLAIALVAVLLPGYLVYRAPSRSLAFMWSLWTVIVGVFGLLFTFDLELFSHTVVLWPEHAVAMLGGTLAVLVIFVSPLVALFTRRGSPIPVATAS